jgi:hypothetical protein
MPARIGFPRPLENVGDSDVHPDNYGLFPQAGEYVGRIGNVYFGDDLVTLDIWLSMDAPYVKGRFQFGGDSPLFATLAAGVPPCSGGVFMGRGGSYDFDTMRVHFTIEDAPKVNGYPRANLVELKLVPWPTSLRLNKAKPLETAEKGRA